MEWLCPVCETINNNYDDKNKSKNENDYIRLHNFCKNCYHKRDDKNWDTHIMMNTLIDQHLPRHHYDIYLSYALVTLIHPSKWFIYESTVSYIKSRVYHRNKQIWRKWRRKTFYRKFIKRILDKWQVQHPQQIESNLILEYLF